MLTSKAQCSRLVRNSRCYCTSCGAKGPSKHCHHERKTWETEGRVGSSWCMVSTYLLWFPSVFNEHTFKSFIFSHFQLHCTLFREDNQQCTEINLSGSAVTATKSSSPSAASCVMYRQWLWKGLFASFSIGRLHMQHSRNQVLQDTLTNKQKPPGVQDHSFNGSFCCSFTLASVFPVSRLQARQDRVKLVLGASWMVWLLLPHG